MKTAADLEKEREDVLDRIRLLQRRARALRIEIADARAIERSAPPAITAKGGPDVIVDGGGTPAESPPEVP